MASIGTRIDLCEFKILFTDFDSNGPLPLERSKPSKPGPIRRTTSEHEGPIFKNLMKLRRIQMPDHALVYQSVKENPYAPTHICSTPHKNGPCPNPPPKRKNLATMPKTKTAAWISASLSSDRLSPAGPKAHRASPRCGGAATHRAAQTAVSGFVGVPSGAEGEAQRFCHGHMRPKGK